jgi:sugar phosphate isomerase/epimerase
MFTIRRGLKLNKFFNIGLSSLCFISKDFDYALNFIASSGISLWEVVDDGLHFLDSNRIKRMLALSSSLNMTLSLHAPYTSVNISASNYRARRFSMDMYRESVEHAHQLGCKFIVFHPGLLDSFTYLFRDLNEPILDGINFLLSIGDLCSDYGITPLIENLATDRSTILKVEDFKSFFSKSNSFKMALDISHAHVMNSFNSYIDSLRDRIAYFHISGNDGLADRHWPLDMGTPFWKDYLKRVFNCNLSGPLIIENLSFSASLKSLNVLKLFFGSEVST